MSHALGERVWADRSCVLFHSDLIRKTIQVPREGLPANAGAVEERLRAIAAAPADHHASTRAIVSRELHEFHVGMVSRRGAMLFKNWLSLVKASAVRTGVCPGCGRQTKITRYESRLYRDYARILEYCPREGVVSDRPSGVPGLSLSPVVTQGSPKLHCSTDIQLGGPFPAMDVRLALERQGEIGAWGPSVPIDDAASGERPEVLSEAPLAPGTRWLCLVGVSGLDYAYWRVPIVVAP
jgi:hypothetical protein